MPFPPSAREIYAKNPLHEVICQLRFPTILQIVAESPAQFQNTIRDRYPLYREENSTAGLPKDVADILASVPVPKGLTQPDHKFLTEGETRLVSLTQEFIALSEKEYQRWESFREEMKLAEKAFREIYRPSYYSRIGLRYRDVLEKAELGLNDRSWAELLNPFFIGELGVDVLAGEVQEIRTQSLVTIPGIDKGLVRIHHGLAKRPGDNAQVYLIDADFYTDKRSQLEDAFPILDSFNNWGGRLFRWAITDTLRDALGPTRIQ